MLFRSDRSVPSPIFLAALIGVEKILRIDFDTSLLEETFVQQALAKLPEQTIAFGRPIGVTVNFSPDRAVRYDLKGTRSARCAIMRNGPRIWIWPFIASRTAIGSTMQRWPSLQPCQLASAFEVRPGFRFAVSLRSCPSPIDFARADLLAAYSGATIG